MVADDGSGATPAKMPRSSGRMHDTVKIFWKAPWLAVHFQRIGAVNAFQVTPGNLDLAAPGQVRHVEASDHRPETAILILMRPILE
jgi:hypothetical protein